MRYGLIPNEATDVCCARVERSARFLVRNGGLEMTAKQVTEQLA